MCLFIFFTQRREGAKFNKKIGVSFYFMPSFLNNIRILSREALRAYKLFTIRWIPFLMRELLKFISRPNFISVSLK